MKTRREMKVGKDAIRLAWTLSEEVSKLSQDIRYANKPADLTYPKDELCKMVRRLDVFREKWMLKRLDPDSKRLDQWPKLWERYL